MHKARVLVSSELILGWLDFEGGQVRDVRFSGFEGGVVEFLIEHCDMPENIEGEAIPTVLPVYKRKVDWGRRLPWDDQY